MGEVKGLAHASHYLVVRFGFKPMPNALYLSTG